MVEKLILEIGYSTWDSRNDGILILQTGMEHDIYVTAVRTLQTNYLVVEMGMSGIYQLNVKANDMHAYHFSSFDDNVKTAFGFLM